MIELTTDAVFWVLIVAAVGLFLVLLLLILAVRAAGKSARFAAPLSQQMNILGSHVQKLGAGQEQLRGGLQTVSDTQAHSQHQLQLSCQPSWQEAFVDGGAA